MSEGLRWACVVSKKVAQKAVDRNKLKRRMRSVLLPLLKQVRDPQWIVLQAKRGASQASFAELKRDMHALVVRSGVVDSRSGLTVR